jgi:hypothetical protein
MRLYKFIHCRIFPALQQKFLDPALYSRPSILYTNVKSGKATIGFSKRSFFLLVDILSSLLCAFYLLYSVFICQPLPPRLATFHTVSVFLKLFFLTVFLFHAFCIYRVSQNSLCGRSDVLYCNCVQFLSVSYSQYLKKINTSSCC